jgi:hypothetical protein
MDATALSGLARQGAGKPDLSDGDQQQRAVETMSQSDKLNLDIVDRDYSD